jgi:hypothetical protein
MLNPHGTGSRHWAVMQSWHTYLVGWGLGVGAQEVVEEGRPVVGWGWVAGVGTAEERGKMVGLMWATGGLSQSSYSGSSLTPCRDAVRAVAGLLAIDGGNAPQG